MAKRGRLLFKGPPPCPMAPDYVKNPQVFGWRELQALELVGSNVF